MRNLGVKESAYPRNEGQNRQEQIDPEVLLDPILPKQSITQSITQALNQSLNQSLSQSLKHSINQSLKS